MLKSLYLYDLRNHEFSQFLYDFVSLGKKNAEVATTLNEMFNSIYNKNKSMETLMNHAKGSNLTEIIVDLDSKRDKTSNGILTYVASFMNHYDNNLVEAATVLQDSVKKYGSNITRTNLQEQTSITTQWVNDWKNDSKLAESVELLTLTNWVGKLETYNNELNQVYLERIKQESELPDEKISDLRKDMVSIYRQLVQHIEAHAVISAHQDFTTFIEQVNVLIEKYNKLAKTQKKVDDQ